MKRLLSTIALYLFHVGFVRPVVFLVLGTRYRRRSLVPGGPCLVVANHNSHLDAALLLTLFPIRRLRKVHPVAAADYFGKNLVRRTMAMALMNAIAIERKPRVGEDPLAPMVEALESGHSLILFPEGSRGEAGVVAKFRPGVGRLVRQFPGLLVVPVFMTGPERIWPRGETVPVPTGIDVLVGKPRTYDPALDAREIAEQVRDDVLALAPAAPPVPGPRPGPPFRVAVCGLETQIRREVVRELTGRLGSRSRTVALSEPALQADVDGVREVGFPPTRSRMWPAVLAWVFRTSGLFKGYKFAETVERARLDEAFQDGRLARYVVGDGSALIDVLAWAEAEFYRGKFDEKEAQRVLRYLSGQRRIPFRRWGTYVFAAPELWLLNVFELARPPVPDLIVYLRSPAEAVLAGKRRRGEPIGRHDRPEMLRRLDLAYETVTESLERRGRVRRLVQDTVERTPAEIAERALAEIPYDGALAEPAGVPSGSGDGEDADDGRVR